MTIRPMRLDDVPQCVACAHSGWGRETAARALDEFTAGVSTNAFRPVYYVAEIGNSVVGMAGYAPSWIDWDTWSLCWVCVLPHVRKLGYGRELVNRCVADLRLIGKHVILTTHVPNFYLPWNFKTIHALSDGSSMMVLDFA